MKIPMKFLAAVIILSTSVGAKVAGQNKEKYDWHQYVVFAEPKRDDTGMLFENLDELNHNDHFKTYRDKTWEWLLNGPSLA